MTDYAKKSYVNAQDNLKVNKAGDRMSGDLIMGNNSNLTIWGRPNSATDAVNKQYVDRAVNNVAISQVSKRGDSMTGDLRMNNNLVKGLPISYPPTNYGGSEAVSWSQARRLVNGSVRGLATTEYVNNRISKPIITVWAEEKGSLSVNAFEWSFGNGSDGLPHALSGYVLPKSGTLIGMGLSLNLTNIKLKVAVTVTKDFDTHSGYSTFQVPVNVGAGTQ